jgi:hypothetical protein
MVGVRAAGVGAGGVRAGGVRATGQWASRLGLAVHKRRMGNWA